MAAQINLGIIWAETGGTTPVTTQKYAEGWEAEIPTFQNFNYMLQGLDQNILHLAEEGVFDWQADINYAAGARVNHLGAIVTCVADNINQDPSLDVTNSYWVGGMSVGGLSNALKVHHGLLLDVKDRTTDTYTGQDLTISARNPMLALNTDSGAQENLAFGNAAGEAVVIKLGTTGLPDLRNIAKDGGNTFRVFHEGHLPTAAEVVGGVGEAPATGKLYAREGLSPTSGQWLEVTSTTVDAEPPEDAVGAGRGWYNLTDGQFYIDIFDGDTSQWVPANPPQIMQPPAEDVTYDDTLTSLGATTVQEAIEALYALI